MRITKYLHSCLLVEDNGKKLLIDPGAFSFGPAMLRAEDIGPVDVIVITHQHPDHYYLPALKILMTANPSTVIVTHDEIGALLQSEGLGYQLIKAGDTVSIAGFDVQAFEAAHEAIPVSPPHNVAYLINERLLHTGDSLSVKGLDRCEILAMPVAGPWLKLVDAIAFAKSFQPRHVIPVHDAIIKDFFLERMYQMCAKNLEGNDTVFHSAKMSEATVFPEL